MPESSKLRRRSSASTKGHDLLDGNKLSSSSNEGGKVRTGSSSGGGERRKGSSGGGERRKAKAFKREKRRAGVIIHWGILLDWLVIVGVGVTLLTSLLYFAGAAPVGQLYTQYALSATLVLHGLQLVVSRKEPISINPWAGIFLPFLAFVLASFFLITDGPWLATQELFRWIQFAMMFWIVVHSARKPEYIWGLISVVVLVALLACFAASYKYFINNAWSPPPMWRTIAPQYDGRATGFFGTPNLLAGMMLVAAPMLLVMGFLRSVPVPMRLLCLYAGGMCLFAIGISISRGAYIAAAMVLLMLPFFVARKIRTRVLGLVAILVLLFATAAGLYYGNEGIRERIDEGIQTGGERTRPIMWQMAWEIFLDNPALGTGTGSYQLECLPRRPDGFVFAPQFAHCEYLNMLSDYGVVGSLFFFGPLGLILGATWWHWRKLPFVFKLRGDRHSKQSPQDKVVLGGILLAFAAVLIHAAVDFHFRSLTILLSLGILLGLAVARVFPGGFTLKGKRVLRFPLLAVAILLSAFSGYQAFGLLYAESRYDMAESDYINYIKRHFQLRRDYTYISDMHEALDEALLWNPEHAESFNLRAAVQMEYYYGNPNRVRSFGKMAENDARSALAITDRYYFFHMNLARSMQMQGYPLEEVEPIYKKALELAPVSPDPWYHYANYLSNFEERQDDAKNAVERALELDPDYGSALSLRQKLLIQ